jgi:hypothetical protein
VAETAPRRVKKVLFDFAGQRVTRLKKGGLTYCSASAASAWRPVAGTYTLTTTPLYREQGAVTGNGRQTVRIVKD